MKARIENENIIIYTELPSPYKSEALGLVISGFPEMGEEIHESEGFYEVVTPSYNKHSQHLGNLYFDDINKVFTYSIVDTPGVTLESIKSNAIKDLKGRLNARLSETDWYIIRKMERNIDIPMEVSAKREGMLIFCNTKETEISQTTTYEELLILLNELESIPL